MHNATAIGLQATFSAVISLGTNEHAVKSRLLGLCFEAAYLTITYRDRAGWQRNPFACIVILNDMLDVKSCYLLPM